jgi:hypothetical protein
MHSNAIQRGSGKSELHHLKFRHKRGLSDDTEITMPRLRANLRIRMARPMMMLAHDFSTDMLLDLVKAGLATAEAALATLLIGGRDAAMIVSVPGSHLISA